MANLTIDQPRIDVLKVEVNKGLSIDRASNHTIEEYSVSQSKLNGAPMTIYVPKNDQRHFLDHLDYSNKPYLISVTCLIESPMKMFVQNQNYSSILFGNDDTEMVKNVVRFETQVRWFDLFKLLPVNNKMRHEWKITDFNNVLNENPYF